MAGESAQEVARKRREKAERLLRSSEAYERGAEGERATAQALSGLPADQWRVLHDLRWPGRTYANIDHIVVGPGGIFVIDSKHWSGNVEVRDQVLMQNGRKRERAVAGAADSAIAVAGLLPGLNPDHVKPVLCFVRDAPDVGWARDVIVCSTVNVVAMLESWKPVFDQAEVQRQFLLLEGVMSSAVGPARPARIANPGPAQGTLTIRESSALCTRAPAPRSRPGHPRPRGRRKKSLRSLVASLLGIIGVIVVLQSGLLKDLTTGLVESQASPSVGLGEAFKLKGSPPLPSLEITASRIVPAAPRKANQATPPGQRSWAVHFVIRNQGQVPLAVPWPIGARVLDDQRVPHMVVSSVTGIRQGRMLPLARPIAAGKTVSGFLVFQLPAANKISEIRMRYGVETARWKVGEAAR